MIVVFVFVSGGNLHRFEIITKTTPRFSPKTPFQHIDILVSSQKNPSRGIKKAEKIFLNFLKKNGASRGDLIDTVGDCLFLRINF
ncbi:hypothetical protein D770_05410 [Flammeovirgaceae bacterium 311]|nr:hypothetical protein D770_05410 [Flammeovirgaceae bacterium 311]